MATTPSASPGGSNYEQIGQILNSPEPSQAETGGGETAETAETPVEATPPEPEAPASEPEAAEQPEVTEPEKEADPYETDDGEVPAETLNTLLKSDRGRQIYASHKTLREYQKPLEQGGIGHVPTVEQLRNYYSTYRDRVMMDNDLTSANPQQAERLLSYLFNPERGPGAQTVASQLASTLAKLNPETYATAAQPFITNYAGALHDRYKEARDSGDEKLRNALWFAANVAHYDMTGEWLKEGAPAQNGQQPDPLAEERQRLAQERSEIERMRSETYQRQDQGWRQQTSAKIGAAVMGEIDKALGPLKATSAPMIYQALKQTFHDKVLAGAQRDSHAWDLYQVKVQQARSDPSVDLPAEYLRLITPVIKEERKKFLEEAGVTVKQQSDARHAELRQIDGNKTLSNGSGSPGAPLGAPVKRNPGESSADFNLRQLRAITT
jgi:hypothetical protein